SLRSSRLCGLFSALRFGCGSAALSASVFIRGFCAECPRLIGLLIFCSLGALFLCGCACPRPPASARPFVFHEDSFAFSNQLVWRYYTDPATGKTAHMNAETPPTYSRHCFVVVRSARQFFQFARFDPRQPVADEASYRRMVQHVISLDPRRDLSPEQKIVIPGYANLYAFSQ